MLINHVNYLKKIHISWSRIHVQKSYKLFKEYIHVGQDYVYSFHVHYFMYDM